MTAVGLVVMTLVVARLTRLITTDEIAEPLRRKIPGIDGGATWIARLALCNWCVAVWVGLGVAVAGKATGLTHSLTWMWWSWPALACAGALVLRWD